MDLPKPLPLEVTPIPMVLLNPIPLGPQILFPPMAEASPPPHELPQTLLVQVPPSKSYPLLISPPKLPKDPISLAEINSKIPLPIPTELPKLIPFQMLKIKIRMGRHKVK